MPFAPVVAHLSRGHLGDLPVGEPVVALEALQVLAKGVDSKARFNQRIGPAVKCPDDFRGDLGVGLVGGRAV
jgi:hypothetical protein